MKIKYYRTISLILILGFSLIVSGCYSLNYRSTSASKPVFVSSMPDGYKFVQHISEKQNQIYIVWGLLPLRVVDQDDVFTPYLRNGDAIASVQSRQERGIISFVVSSLSYGFIQVLQTEFDGDLIKKS